MNRSTLTNVIGAVVLVGLVVWMFRGEQKDVRVTVIVPELSTLALHGQQIFNGICAACHGQNAAGSENGPPLIDQKYNPRHHADGAFNIAIANGVRQHHWKFGSMPPQPEFDSADIPAVVAFIRELQEANGIN